MNAVQVNTVLGIAFLLLLGTSCFLLWRSGKKTSVAKRKIPQDIEALVVDGKIPLQDIAAQLWLKRGEVHIAELAPIWREEKVQVTTDKPCEFENRRIQAFYAEHVQKLRNASQQQLVCRNLLSLLDREGQCPSVVNASDDVEASWDSNTYTLLGKTNLLDHSLNVALQIIRLLQESNADHIVPDALVAALAHDLGKLPSIRGHLYSLGEHPLAAGRILAGIESFKQLVKQEEISRAIKLHHKRPDDFLGKTLKRADQLARQEEMEQALEQLPPLEEPAKKRKMEKTAVDFLAPEDAEKKVEVPKLIDLSRWFDAQDFLEQMRPHINKVTAGRKFMAFSMPDGYVYFQPKVLEEIAKKQAERAGVLDVATMEADEMRQVLLSIVFQLRREDVIADIGLKKNYFGGYFTITMKSKNTMKGYYTPCHAESFGSIAVMESLKTGILLDFVSVESFHEEK
ncbi:MAG: HD domain-containing protein [Pseudomonadota bacterium]